MGRRGSITNRNGFTLVELLVVTAIIAVVGGLGTGFFLSTLTARTKAAHRLEVQENARLALARMAYEIRRAVLIEGTSDFGVNLATSPGTLDLDMPGGGTTSVTFSILSGALRIRDGAGAPVLLTTNDVEVSDLTFENHTTANGRSQNIKITLTVDHVGGSSGQFGASTTVSTTVELRGE
jgi:prepilin-type N-terminal cleavage/methylation domain-containing protein